MADDLDSFFADVETAEATAVLDEKKSDADDEKKSTVGKSDVEGSRDFEPPSAKRQKVRTNDSLRTLRSCLGSFATHGSVDTVVRALLAP